MDPLMVAKCFLLLHRRHTSVIKGSGGGRGQWVGYFSLSPPIKLWQNWNVHKHTPRKGILNPGARTLEGVNSFPSGIHGQAGKKTEIKNICGRALSDGTITHKTINRK